MREEPHRVATNAERLVASGRLSAAIDEYRKLLGQDPADTTTLNRLGDLHFRAHRLEEAIGLFKQTARLLAQKGFFAKAIAVNKKIIRHDPSQIAAYSELAGLYNRQGLTSDALAQYQVVADYYWKHEDLHATIDIYERMVDVDERNPTYRLRLAELQQQAGRTSEAQRQYTAIALQMLSYERGPEAARVLSAALEVDPKDLDFLRASCERLRNAGFRSLARSLVSATLQLNPDADSSFLQSLTDLGHDLSGKVTAIAETQSTGTSREVKSPLVFISYSHDSDEHMDRVLAFSDRLRGDGINASVDQYEEAPRQGWPAWSENQLKISDFVLVLCTKNYKENFLGGKEVVRKGSRWEGQIIAQQLYDAGTENTKFIPVVFSPEDGINVPVSLRGSTWYHVDDPDGYEDLYRRLTSQPASERPALGALRKLPTRQRRTSRRSLPSPALPPTESQRLQDVAERLAVCILRKEEFALAGKDHSAVQAEILELRRTLREGGRLRTGDFLFDGRFRLAEIVGQGGFGTVWRSYDRQSERLVAIKVLHGQYAHDRSRIERFFRGARQMAGLSHEGIVGIVEKEAEEHGYYYYVMEYLAGGDLQRAVLRGSVGPKLCAELVLQVGTALEYAHARGLVHRDVKPSNILLSDVLLPKLSDFDLVRAPDTTGGTRNNPLGSLLYSAPEALRDASSATAAADVYSLGMCIVFGLIARELPYDVLTNQPQFLSSLECSEALRGLLRSTLSAEPAKRPDSVRTFLSQLEEVLPVRRGATLDQVIFDYLGSVAEEESLVLLMDQSPKLAKGRTSTLSLATHTNSSGGPVSGAHIAVRMVSVGSEVLKLAEGTTDDEGLLELAVDVPEILQDAAIIVRAASDLGSAEAKVIL